MPYELLDHTGDIAMEVREPSLEELFRTAARAMFEIMVGTAAEGREPDSLRVEGEDEADLLRAFLADLLYNFSAEGTILTVDSVVTGSGKAERLRLEARGRSRSFDPGSDELQTELKAVTYHQLGVRQVREGWIARVVFDV